MNKLKHTCMTYFYPTFSEIIFPGNTNMELYTQNDVIESKNLLDSYPELFYEVNLAIQNTPCVKILSKDKYLELWRKEDLRITRYSDGKLSYEELLELWNI